VSLATPQSYWAVAQLETHHERLALHCLSSAGYQTFAPRILAARRPVLLFPSYVFVAIESGWWRARWAAGVVRLLTNGGYEPAHVPDHVIDELRQRERNGLVVLPAAPALKRGDAVQITHGPFVGQLGLFDGMRPHERCAVLLQLLGRIELPERDIIARADWI
jgi:Transcription termination factor nusG